MKPEIDRDKPVSLVEHIEELRKRLLRVLLIWLVCSIAAYQFTDWVIGLLAAPTGGFVFLAPTEAFMARLKLAFIMGGFCTVPIALHQTWAFVEVALKVEERRVLGRVLPASYLLFACGVAFAWFVILPVAVKFLFTFGSENMKPFITINNYVGFAAMMTLGMGLTFQLPIVVVVLVWLGLVEPAWLAAHRREVVLGIAVFAAFITPGPDVFSQLALAVPTYALFEISIWVSRALVARRVATPSSRLDPTS